MTTITGNGVQLWVGRSLEDLQFAGELIAVKPCSHIEEVIQALTAARAEPRIHYFRNQGMHAIPLGNSAVVWHAELGWGNFLGSLYATVDGPTAFTFRFRQYLDDKVGPESEDLRYGAKCDLPGLTQSEAIKAVRKVISELTSLQNARVKEIPADETGIGGILKNLKNLPSSHVWHEPIPVGQAYTASPI